MIDASITLGSLFALLGIIIVGGIAWMGLLAVVDELVLAIRDWMATR